MFNLHSSVRSPALASRSSRCSSSCNQRLWKWWRHQNPLNFSLCLLCCCPPQLAYLLSQFQYFVCPVGFNSETNRFMVECEPSDIFVMQEYTLPVVFRKTLGLVRIQRPLHQEMFVEALTFRKAADLHFCFCTAAFGPFRGRENSANHILKIFCSFPLSGKGQHVPLSDPQHLPVIVCIPHRAFWWFLCQWF